MSTARPVPDGFNTVTPFLNLREAAAAAEFYRQAFGAVETTRIVAPDGVILHIELRIGNSTVMLAEAVNDPPSESSIHLYLEDADRCWDRAVAAGALVVVPLQDMYWGDRYGLLRDRWGTHWAIRRRIEDLSTQEVQRRITEAALRSKAQDQQR
jgi:PhnB protein